MSKLKKKKTNITKTCLVSNKGINKKKTKRKRNVDLTTTTQNQNLMSW